MTAKQIKAARRRAGLTAEGAARLVGVTVATWHAWEQGARVPGGRLSPEGREALEERIVALLTEGGGK